MASGKSRPFLETLALPAWVMVGSVILALVIYLLAQCTGAQTLMVHMGFVSIITFTVFGIDKYRSGREKRRVSERNLWSLAVLGGALGALVAMGIFRHKTRRAIFTMGMPTLLFVHLVILATFVLE